MKPVLTFNFGRAGFSQEEGPLGIVGRTGATPRISPALRLTGSGPLAAPLTLTSLSCLSHTPRPKQQPKKRWLLYEKVSKDFGACTQRHPQTKRQRVGSLQKGLESWASTRKRRGSPSFVLPCPGHLLSLLPGLGCSLPSYWGRSGLLASSKHPHPIPAPKAARRYVPQWKPDGVAGPLKSLRCRLSRNRTVSSAGPPGLPRPGKLLLSSRASPTRGRIPEARERQA